MSDITPIVVSIITGIALGIVYGSFFLLSKKKALSTLQKIPSYQDLLIIYGGAAIRISFVALFTYLLLLYPSIPFILAVVSFLGGFWYVVYVKKVH